MQAAEAHARVVIRAANRISAGAWDLTRFACCLPSTGRPAMELAEFHLNTFTSVRTMLNASPPTHLDRPAPAIDALATTLEREPSALPSTRNRLITAMKVAF
jgi:hypothetical protein